MKVPTGIAVHTKSQELELQYDDGVVARLPFEFLRVYSPSAEVKGHAPGQEILQVGKKGVEVTMVEPMGNYALKIFPTGMIPDSSAGTTWKSLLKIRKASGPNT